jgi:hypothetical protein
MKNFISIQKQMELSIKNHIEKVNHIRHCIKYKRVVFRCIFPSLPFSEEVEKYLFTFIGVFPLSYVALSYTAIGPGLLHSSRSLLLHESGMDFLRNTSDEP